MKLEIAGNIQSLILGQIDKDTLHPVDVAQMRYGLGAAGHYLTSAVLIGETIIYDGVGHIFTPEKTWEEKKTVHAAFIAGIHAKPKSSMTLAKSQTVGDFYQDLFRKYPHGFVLVGECIFASLDVTYLKRPPIYGEDINFEFDKYWGRENFSNCQVQLFGLGLSKLDGRIFYNNPFEVQSGALPTHTHVLKDGMARHLLTQSKLKSGTFYVDSIEIT